MSKRAREDGPSGGRKKAKGHRSIITNIRMKNFLSFADHELRPGPKLNLILGVNGAGKSTVNNAICIGLGFDSKLLDRFDGVGEFVKRGQKTGFVEIRLSQPGGNDVVIKAVLEKEQKNAKFTIDGKATKRKEVLSFVRSLGINLDNLCHFLPQEKVVQFAALAGKPAEMLREVELAVGPPQMIEDHKQLIDLTQNSSKKLEDFENLKNKLEDLKKQAEDYEQELRRFERIQELEKQIQLAEWKQLLVRMTAAKGRYEARREEWDTCKQETDVLEGKFNEIRDQVDEAKRELDEAKQAKSGDESSLYRVQKELEEMREDLMEREKDSLQAIRKIERLQAEKDNLDEDIRQSEDLVARYEAERDTFVVPPDIEQQIVAAQQTLTQAHRRLGNLQEAEQRAQSQYNHAQRELAEIERQIQQFRSVKDRKIQSLKNSNPELFRAYSYVADHQNMFEAHVYGPIMLEIDVDDPLNAAYVESCVGARMLDGFITQNEHDYKLLHDMMNPKNNRDSPIKKITVFKMGDGRVREPNTSEETWGHLRRNGIQYHLFSKVKAETAVMAVLTQQGGLDRAFAGETQAYDRWQKVLEDQSLIFKQQNGKKAHVLGGGCFTEKGKFSATFSMYGNQTMLPKVEPFKRAQKLVVGDSKQEEKLQARKNELERSLRAAEAELATAKENVAEINPEIAQKRMRLKELKEARDKRKNMETRINQTKRIIADKKKQDPMRARPKYERDRDTANNSLLELAAEMKEKGQKLARLKINVQAHLLREQPLQDKYADLERHRRREGGILTDKKKELNDLAKDVEKLKKEYEQARKKKKDEMPVLNDADREGIQALPNSEEDLQRTVDEFQDELAGMGEQSDRRQDYEDTKAEIVDIQRKIEDDEEEIKDFTNKIKRLKDRWLDGDEEGELYPAPAKGLRNVIALINDEFSNTFAQMGNVGEVKLREAKTESGEDDFANYAIEILVKFRKTQDLQKLDGHVQSGGETSLSTMLFLVSLQQITEAPFRVVDEINQGMDQHYEKAVFDRIVKVSCLPKDTSQTFLITPKLAHGLLDDIVDQLGDDADGMTVHFAVKGVEVAQGGIW